MEKQIEILGDVRRFTEGRYLYAIETEFGRLKIGYSINLQRRIYQFENLGGSRIVRSYFSEKCINAPQVEARLHQKLKEFNVFGEWYELSFEDAVKAIKETIADIGVLNEADASQMC